MVEDANLDYGVMYEGTGMSKSLDANPDYES